MEGVSKNISCEMKPHFVFANSVLTSIPPIIASSCWKSSWEQGVVGKAF